MGDVRRWGFNGVLGGRGRVGGQGEGGCEEMRGEGGPGGGLAESAQGQWTERGFFGGWQEGCKRDVCMSNTMSCSDGLYKSYFLRPTECSSTPSRIFHLLLFRPTPKLSCAPASCCYCCSCL